MYGKCSVMSYRIIINRLGATAAFMRQGNYVLETPPSHKCDVACSSRKSNVTQKVKRVSPCNFRDNQFSYIFDVLIYEGLHNKNGRKRAWKYTHHIVKTADKVNVMI